MGFIDESCKTSNTDEVFGTQWDTRSQTFNNFYRASNSTRPNDNRNRRTVRGSTVVCENYRFNGHTIDRLVHSADQVLNVLKPNLLFKNNKSDVDFFPFKQKIDIPSEPTVPDLNHLNFFNFNYLDDHPDIPNDEERSDPSPNRYGTLSRHSDSTFEPLNKNEGGHSQGPNEAASEDKWSLNHEDNHNVISEGDESLIHLQVDVHQDITNTQNLRRYLKSSPGKGINMIKNYASGIDLKAYTDAD
nr:hypothetical protein [Tanacetum cinerariifolium]